MPDDKEWISIHQDGAHYWLLYANLGEVTDLISSMGDSRFVIRNCEDRLKESAEEHMEAYKNIDIKCTTYDIELFIQLHKK